jgi:hypothetical protein
MFADARRLLLHASVAAAGVLVLLCIQAPGAAQAASCAKVVEGQSRTLVGQLTEDRFSEEYSSGGMPRTSNHKITRFSMGTLAIRAATCRSDGRWRVLDPVLLAPAYANFSGSSVPFGATGYGVSPVQVRGRSLSIRAIQCRSSKVWGAVSGLTGIPVPGPFWLSLAQYVGGQAGVAFLPKDKTRCQGIVAGTVPFAFGQRGRLTLRPFSASRTYLVQDLGDLKIKKTLTVRVTQR